MKLINRLFSQFSIAGELVGFFWKRKLWWMIPLVVMLIGLGLLIIFAQGTGIAPFVYTLF